DSGLHLHGNRVVVAHLREDHVVRGVEAGRDRVAPVARKVGPGGRHQPVLEGLQADGPPVARVGRVAEERAHENAPDAGLPRGSGMGESMSLHGPRPRYTAGRPLENAEVLPHGSVTVAVMISPRMVAAGRVTRKGKGV